MNYQIRWLIRRDLPEVLEIEQAATEFPWIEKDVYNCLRRRDCIGMVFVEEGAELIRGFMIYELLKGKLRILKLTVDPGYQRQGVGRALIERLRGKLSQQRRRHIDVLLRETNVAAQLFLQRLGFGAIDVVRRGWNADEDMYLLRYTLDKRPHCALGANRIGQQWEDV